MITKRNENEQKKINKKTTYVTSEVDGVVSILTSATGIPRRAASIAKAAAG